MAEQKMFRALWVEETSPGQYTRRVIDRAIDDLPEGDVLIRVKYSSLNYKDALSASGGRGVTRRYPHTPGIDAAGVVEESTSPDFRAGDEVLVIADQLGVSAPGGFGQYVRVPDTWLVRLPRRLTLRQSMVYGTAGFTAAMCVDRIMRAGLIPEQGEVLVTGSTGGVGSIAVGILAKEGFQVTAATGKLEKANLLRALGASQVILRNEVLDTSGKPLLHARWAGVVDTVGGDYLSSAIRATQAQGVVTACGNAAGPNLPLTVYPFILRGVTLIGIDVTRVPRDERVRLWEKLSREWKFEGLDELGREVALDGLEDEIGRMLQGGQIGRIIINHDPD